jgi:hypothetical protein
VAQTRPFAAGFRLTDVLLHGNMAKYKPLVLRSRTQGINSSHICKLHCYRVIYLHVSILYSFIHSRFPFVSRSLSCQQSVQCSSSSFIHSVIHYRISSVLSVFSAYASASFRYMTFVLTLNSTFARTEAFSYKRSFLSKSDSIRKWYTFIYPYIDNI